MTFQNWRGSGLPHPAPHHSSSPRDIFPPTVRARLEGEQASTEAVPEVRGSAFGARNRAQSGL